MDIKRIEFSFGGNESLKKEFIRIVELNKLLLDGVEFNRPISYSTVKRVTKGRGLEALKRANHAFRDLTVNDMRYQAGEPKNKIDIKFKNFNAWSLTHDEIIMDRIRKESNGDFNKYIQRIDMYMGLLEKEDYRYNVVYYGYFKK